MERMLPKRLEARETVMRSVFPKRLELGDTIGVITPSEPVLEEKHERYNKGIEALIDKGFKIVVGNFVLSNPDSYISAGDVERAEDINAMFASPEVTTILCTTGGYNSNGLLPYLNYDLIKNNPKIFVGLSDPTAIVNAIHKKTGLVTFHGPSVMSDFGKGIHPYTEKYFERALMGAEPIGRVEELSKWEILKEGKAQGRLIGGNLSTLQLMIGTEYEPQWKDCILFWEEIGAEPYFIEQKLIQFKQAGILNQLNGMIVGRCVDCEMKSFKRLTSIQEVVNKVCKDYKFPIIYNVDLGHTREKITIPLGVRGYIDTNNNEFSIVDRAVR